MRVPTCIWDLSTYGPSAAEGTAGREHALALDRNLAHAHSLIGLGGDLHRSRRRNGGSHRRGPPAQSTRCEGLHLDAYSRYGEEPPLPLRASGRVVSTGDRANPEITRLQVWGGGSRSRSLVGSMRRVPQSRPASRSTRPSPPPASAPPGRRGATTKFSGRVRTHSRRHAQGRGPRTMTRRPPPRRDPGRRRGGLLIRSPM